MSRDWNIVDEDDARTSAEPPSAVGLDSRRIHLVVEERRAANRARIRRRLMVPVALAIAFAAAARAAFAWRTSPAFSIACALTAAVAAVIALRTSRTSAAIAKANPVDAPEVPPDFESLGGDGGDTASRLGRIQSDR